MVIADWQKLCCSFMELIYSISSHKMWCFDKYTWTRSTDVFHDRGCEGILMRFICTWVAHPLGDRQIFTSSASDVKAHGWGISVLDVAANEFLHNKIMVVTRAFKILLFLNHDPSYVYIHGPVLFIPIISIYMCSNLLPCIILLNREHLKETFTHYTWSQQKVVNNAIANMIEFTKQNPLYSDLKLDDYYKHKLS